MQPYVSMLFQAALGASFMLCICDAFLSMSERLALFTVTITGFRLYMVFRRFGYSAF